MTTYTLRSHFELDEISNYDKEQLKKVINQYNKWYQRHMKESDRIPQNQASWAYAIYEIKDFIDKNTVDALSTLEETREVYGVAELFLDIDIIREELLEQNVHISLSEKEPVLLMDILNKLEICTRHVIQNTSIQRLHQKSWTHANALRDLGGSRALITTDDAVLPASVKTSHQEANVVTLLHHMKQLRV